MRDLVIGVDCSTTASKAVVFDRFGSLVSEGRCSIPLLMPQSSWHEQPSDSWWIAMAQALREATAPTDPRRLAALCIVTQRETFVPVDESGQPLRDAIVWMDERCRSLLPRLESVCGTEYFHQVTGKPLSGNLSIGKILWLKENEPQVFDRAAKFVDVHAFLAHRLTGQFRTGWGCADPMGLFDTRKHVWSQDLIECVGLRLNQLPEAYAPGEIIGTVTPDASALCSLPVGLPVVAGLGDGQSAGLGANITRSGQAYLSLGTSVISGTFASSYLTDRAFRTMTGGARDTFLLETVLLSGTYIVDWFLEHFARPELSVEAFEAAIQTVPPGARGLMLVPYWNSAMNPYWDAGASGIIVGWRGIHDRTHLYRAILEGIAFELRLHISGVEAALGREIERLIAVGGGASSSVWLQIIADVTGKPVVRSALAETTALGAAILAATAADWYADVSDAAGAMTHVDLQAFEPNAGQAGIYSRLYDDVYRHLFPALQTRLNRLTALTDVRAES